MRFILFGVLVLSVASCATLRPDTTIYKDDKKVEEVGSVRGKIVQDCESCIGVRYKYAGKDRRGFDCSGFSSYVMAENGISVSASSSLQSKEGRKIPVNNVKKGDLLFFGTNGRVNHVAVVVSNTKDGINVIHSTSSRGVILQNVSKSLYWKPRILYARDVISN